MKKSATTSVSKPPSPQPPPKVPTPPQTPAVPATYSPPKPASLATNVYPMPKALPTRPVCSDEGRGLLTKPDRSLSFTGNSDRR